MATRNLHFVGVVLLLICASFDLKAAADSAGEPVLAPSWDTPVFSPSGSTVLFVSDLGGTTTVWIADRDGAKSRPLLNWLGSNQKDPDWSPDGQQIVFASDVGGGDYNIWIADAGGTNARRLTHNAGSNVRPRYSPDGSKVLFTSNRTGKRELWIMSSDGTNAKPVGLQSILVNDPAWSPDGLSIVYSGCTRPPIGGALTDGVCNLYVIRSDASVTTKITNGSFQDWDPDWNAQGIIFSSSRNGGQDIYIVQPNGSNLARIPLMENGLNLFPRWDKSTGSFVFSRVSAQPNIFLSTVGGQETRVTNYASSIPLGDLDADGSVRCADLSIVKAALGKRSGTTGYDLRADLDRNAVVDVRDLSTVARGLPRNVVCN